MMKIYYLIDLEMKKEKAIHSGENSEEEEMQSGQ